MIEVGELYKISDKLPEIGDYCLILILNGNSYSEFRFDGICFVNDQPYYEEDLEKVEENISEWAVGRAPFLQQGSFLKRKIAVRVFPISTVSYWKKMIYSCNRCKDMGCCEKRN